MHLCSSCYTDKLPPSANDVGDDANWAVVSFRKHAPDGTLLPKRYDYIQDLQTGDLYVKESPLVVAEKCYGLMLAAPFYMLGMMAVNTIRIATDTYLTAKRVLEEFGEVWKQRGLLEASANVFFAVIIEIPINIILDICRIVKAPFFAIGFFFAALYGVISPYEGRKWVGAVESAWHEGLDYHHDIRYNIPGGLESEEEMSRTCQEIKAGQIFFIAWCMQKRGNVNEKIQNLDRFVPYTA